ncbi:MAG: hypothetical protein AAF485_08855 [Chloroflexota bacterium]
MTSAKMELTSGQIIYDPRGQVDADPIALAPRVPSLNGLRLGVLDNSKWNGGKLLRKTVAQLEQESVFAEIHTYLKESFSRNASSALIQQIVAENDIVITAIGD